MRYKEIAIGLFESPRWIGPSDFDLANPKVNSTFVAKQLPKVVNVIEDAVEYKIVQTGDDQNGWIFMYGRDTPHMAHYVVNYKSRTWNWMPKTATQCLIWRDIDSPYVVNVTQRIFFGYLLQRFGAVLSDSHQTDRGREFWRGRMAVAANTRYKVGVVNMHTRVIDWFDPSKQTYTGWYMGQDAFGSEEKYAGIRYIISK